MITLWRPAYYDCLLYLDWILDEVMPFRSIVECGLRIHFRQSLSPRHNGGKARITLIFAQNMLKLSTRTMSFDIVNFIDVEIGTAGTIMSVY